MTTWTIGDVKVTKVVEHELPVPLEGLLLDVPDELAKLDWLQPFLASEGNALLSIHGLVIEAGDRTILVDTCVGNEREGLVMPPMPSSFLESLAAAGFEVGDIDTVVCTHLHFDHVGWNTRLVDGQWVPTFPNARYLFGRIEHEHWSRTEGDYAGNVRDTVHPVIEAGLADLVEVDHRLCPEVRLVPTPGHTPGHVSVVVESGGQRAVITGDMAHHPIQFADPDLGMPADTDSGLAAKTRRVFLAERTDDGALVIGTHFGGPTAGRITPDGDGWRLD